MTDAKSSNDALLLLFLVFVTTLLLKGSSHLTRYWKHTAVLRQLTIKANRITTLRQQNTDLRSPDNFVQYAKNNREINQLEKEREKLTKELNSIHRNYLQKTLQSIRIFFWIGIILLHRNRPVFQLGFSGGRFYGRFLNIACDVICRAYGHIGLVSWLFLCNATINAWLECLFPLDTITLMKKDE